MSDRLLICVVDDDSSLRKALVRLITAMGYDCKSYMSAEACIASGEAETAGCIITDIHMPGLDGFAFKRKLLANGCPTPVIMITGRVDAHLEKQAFEAGAFAFFRKPLRADALAKRLSQVFGTK